MGVGGAARELRRSFIHSFSKLPFIYPLFHSTLYSTRPNARPRTPLYSLYVFPLSVSWSIFSALSSAPGGSANEIYAAVLSYARCVA